MLPPGGLSRYPEIIRNISICKKLMLESGENFYQFSYGGARRGIVFTQNKQEDIALIIANQTGRDRDQVVRYLTDAEYISPSSFDALVKDTSAGKGFFDVIRKYKKDYLDELIGGKKTEAEIEQLYSEKILFALTEFKVDKQKVSPFSERVKKDELTIEQGVNQIIPEFFKDLPSGSLTNPPDPTKSSPEKTSGPQVPIIKTPNNQIVIDEKTKKAREIFQQLKDEISSIDLTQLKSEQILAAIDTVIPRLLQARTQIQEAISFEEPKGTPQIQLVTPEESQIPPQAHEPISQDKPKPLPPWVKRS